jgi:hypothetical protein
MSNYGQRYMTQRANAPRRIAQVAPQAFPNNPELVAEIFGMINPLAWLAQAAPAPKVEEPTEYTIEARGQGNWRKAKYLVLAMRGGDAGAREHWWVWKDGAADLAFKTWQTSNPGGVLPATEFEAFAKMMAVLP